MLPRIALGEIMPAKTGSVDPAKFPNESFDLYSIPAFDLGSPEVLFGRQIGSAKQVVKTGDVLLSRIVPHIRRAWIVGRNRGRRIIASGEWIVFRSDQFDQDYLRHLFVGDHFHAQFMQTVSGVGGSLLRARPAQVADIEIPLVLIEKQRQVAQKLARAEHLQRMRRYSLQMCDELLPSTFIQMFGDPALNPHSFPLIEGEQLFDLSRGGAKCGPFGSALRNSEYVASGIPVWTMENVQSSFREDGCLYITGEKFKQLKAYAIQDGDILISRAGTVGRMAIVRTKHKNSIMHSNLIRLAVDHTKVIPEYYVSLMTWFGSRIAKLKTGQEDAYTFMNTGTLGDLPIPLPPMEEQKKFLAFVRRHEHYRAIYAEAARQADHLFQTLLHQAFK